jgi:hypothetical protein
MPDRQPQTRRGLLRRRDCLRTRIDRHLDAPMVVLAIAFIGLMTLALPHAFVSLDQVHDAVDLREALSPLERAQLLTTTAASGLALLAIPFWLEAGVRLFWLERPDPERCGVPRLRRSRVLHILVCALVPPLRTGLSPATLPGRVWLPGLGWRMSSRPLSRRVQRAMGVPMLAIGLLILPVLVMEVAFAKLVREHEALALGLDVATRVIWLAFALEFVLLLAVTPRKLEHAVRHWVDLVIILLPFAAFLRSLQVLRAAQLLKAQQMSKLAATYRLRGLAIKLLQALLLLRVLENLSDGLARRRIAKVRETIDRRQEEIGELEHELVDLRSGLARRLWVKRRRKRMKARKSGRVGTGTDSAVARTDPAVAARPGQASSRPA